MPRPLHIEYFEAYDWVKSKDRPLYYDEHELIRVTVTNAWKSEFTYDGKLRRRMRKEYTWQSSAWLQTNEVRYVV